MIVAHPQFKARSLNKFHLIKFSFWKRKCLLAGVVSFRKTMITDKH